MRNKKPQVIATPRRSLIINLSLVAICVGTAAMAFPSAMKTGPYGGATTAMIGFLLCASGIAAALQASKKPAKKRIRR